MIHLIYIIQTFIYMHCYEHTLDFSEDFIMFEKIYLFKVINLIKIS